MPITAPTDIAGCQVWLDASQIAGHSAGDPIGTFADLSGNAHDATNATAGEQPTYQPAALNGKAVLRFDGVNDWLALGDLSAAIPTGASLFVVATISDTEYEIYDDGSADTWWRYGGDGHGYMGVFRTARVNAYPSSMPTAGGHYFSLVSDGAGYEFFTDGVSAGAQAGAYNAGTNHRIARGVTESPTFLNGDIAEVIVYNTALSTADRQSVESYLNAKWFTSPPPPPAGITDYAAGYLDDSVGLTDYVASF